MHSIISRRYIHTSTRLFSIVRGLTDNVEKKFQDSFCLSDQQLQVLSRNKKLMNNIQNNQDFLNDLVVFKDRMNIDDDRMYNILQRSSLLDKIINLQVMDGILSCKKQFKMNVNDFVSNINVDSCDRVKHPSFIKDSIAFQNGFQLSNENMCVLLNDNDFIHMVQKKSFSKQIAILQKMFSLSNKEIQELIMSKEFRLESNGKFIEVVERIKDRFDLSQITMKRILTILCNMNLKLFCDIIIDIQNRFEFSNEEMAYLLTKETFLTRIEDVNYWNLVENKKLGLGLSSFVVSRMLGNELSCQIFMIGGDK